MAQVMFKCKFALNRLGVNDFDGKIVVNSDKNISGVEGFSNDKTKIAGLIKLFQI